MTVEPLTVVFHRSAEEVSKAGFMPDSNEIWFVSRPSLVISHGLRFAGSTSYLERWRIIDGALIDRRALQLRGCASFGLSPDAKFLGCVDRDGTLSFSDIDRDHLIFKKKGFGKYDLIGSGDHEALGSTVAGFPGSADVYFSPGDQYGIAVPIDAAGSTFALDLTTGKQVKLRHGLRNFNRGHAVTFVQPNQVLISPYEMGQSTVEATLMSFPSAKVILRTKLPPGGLFPAADPAFVIVRPFGRFAYASDPIQRTAAVEYRTGDVIISDAQTLDVFGDRYVTEELPSGKIGVYRRHKGLEASIAVE